MRVLKNGTKVKTTRFWRAYNEYDKSDNPPLGKFKKGLVGIIKKRDRDQEKEQERMFVDEYHGEKCYFIEFSKKSAIVLFDNEFEVVNKK